MRKRKPTLEDINRLPKEAIASSRPRETLATFTREYQAKEQARKQADLEASLQPIKREQGKLLGELREKELREIKRRLILQPSPEAGFIPYSGSLRPDEVTQKINEACSLFLETDGSALTKQELTYFRHFLHVNSDLLDLTSASQWSKAWFYVQSKLNPVEPEQAEIDPLIETVPDLSNEPAPETVPDTIAELRSAVQDELLARCRPVYDDFYARIERESGVSLTPDQQRKIIAFMNQRGYEALNKPQAWMNALWHLFPEYLPESERLERQERIDRETLSMDEYKRKYNIVINTSPVRAYADQRSRD